MFKDIDIFVHAAQAILQGHDPYTLANTEVFYPLPFYFLFLPFVVLPLPLVHIIWTGLQCLALWLVLRKRTLIVALSIPVLLILILGQVDIITLGLFALLRAGIGGGVALALLSLKPQLVLLLGPWFAWHWLRNDQKQLLILIAVLGTAVLVSLLIEPDWPLRLLARSGERMRAAKTSSIWGLLSLLPAPLWIGGAVLVSAALVYFAWRSNDPDLVATVGLLISPFIFSYNLVPLFLFVRQTGRLIFLTALSWLAFGLGAAQESDRWAALLGLVVLFIQLEKRRSVQWRWPGARPDRIGA